MDWTSQCILLEDIDIWPDRNMAHNSEIICYGAVCTQLNPAFGPKSFTDKAESYVMRKQSSTANNLEGFMSTLGSHSGSYEFSKMDLTTTFGAEMMM